MGKPSKWKNLKYSRYSRAWGDCGNCWDQLIYKDLQFEQSVENLGKNTAIFHSNPTVLNGFPIDRSYVPRSEVTFPQFLPSFPQALSGKYSLKLMIQSWLHSSRLEGKFHAAKM